MATTDVQVHWIVVSDDSDTMEGCETVKDIRAKICDKRDCFRCDVVLFDGDYNLVDDAQAAPSTIMCMSKPKVKYDTARWLLCLTEEAVGGESSSVERAVRLMKEQEDIDTDVVLSAALTKCIADTDSCSILIDAGASMVNIISADTSIDHVNTPTVLRDIASALNAVKSKSGLAVDHVVDLVNGVSAFLAAGPSAPVAGNEKHDHTEVLLEHGVLGSICVLLDHENRLLREKALNMISGITQKASSQRKDMLVQSDIFKYLASALKQGIVEVDLFKLSIKLFSKSAARMRSAIDSGFVNEVLSLAAGDDADVAVVAADTYEAIITNANVQMLGEFSENAVGKLLDMLKVEDVWSGRTDRECTAQTTGHPFASALKALCVFAKKLTEDNRLSTSLPLMRIKDANILDAVLAHPVASVVSAAKQVQLLLEKRDAEMKVRTALESTPEAAECKASSVASKPAEATLSAKKKAEPASPSAKSPFAKSSEENEPASPSKVETAQKKEDDFSMSSGKDDDECQATDPTTTGSASTLPVEEEDHVGELQTSVRPRGVKLNDGKSNGNKPTQKAAPSRGQRKKKNKTQQDDGEEATEVAEEGDGKDIMMLIVQYLAAFLNFVAKMLGQICEIGATGFCAITDLAGDVCPKKHKGGRALRRGAK